MSTENGTAIRSLTEAVILARQAKKDGRVIPIVPCVRLDSTTGSVNICPNMDPKLVTLCKDPDGVMLDNGALQCPMQKGTLVLTK
ncbi:hypothetical protein KKE03_04710 [Patescibacteria group bacterium]|nr:hypothetical protein [Patescibacteria group bacterium]